MLFYCYGLCSFSCWWMFCLHGTHNSILTVGSYLSSLGYSLLTIHICSFPCYYAEEYQSSLPHLFVTKRRSMCALQRVDHSDHRKNVTFMGLWSLTIGYCGKCCGKRCIIRIGMEEGTVGFSYHVHFFSRQNRVELGSKARDLWKLKVYLLESYVICS